MNLAKNKKLVLSMALNLLLAVAVLFLLYIVSPQFTYRLDSVQNFGRYSVRTYRMDSESACLEIFLGPEEYLGRPHVPRRIYSRSGAVAFVETFGADVTGTGMLDLVIKERSSSAGDNGSKYLVLELDGPSVREIAVIAGLAGVGREDVNGDGVDELVGGDEAYCFFGGCCRADSPCPQVVLSFEQTQGEFVLNKKLMAKPPLSEEQLHRLSLKYKDDPWWAGEVLPPPGLFSTMFDLIYSGNERQAWELLDASWPDGSGLSKDEWRKDVEDSLCRSPFNPLIVVADRNRERL